MSSNEELLPMTLKSPEGVSYRLFFDAEQRRAYIDPPATPGPGGLPLVTDIFSTPAATREEAIKLLTDWAQAEGWEMS